MAEIAIATEADRKETSDVRGAVKPLREVKFVQNIGRFKAGKSVSYATFGACTLVFGENGWGKSTLADLLRSLTTDNPDIVIGRKTLAGGVDQKAVLRFGDQQAVFQNGTWSGIRPRIAVYDSVFVNENVFSGSECRRARDAKRDIPVPLSPCARATTCTCRGRPAPGPRLRHFAPPPDPYDEWLDGVSDALASGS